MALYRPSKKPKRGHETIPSASTDKLLVNIGKNRNFYITDIILTAVTSADTVNIRLGTAASSASNEEILKLYSAANNTAHYKLKEPLKVEYGSGNKLYARGGTAGKATVTILGYEE